MMTDTLRTQTREGSPLETTMILKNMRTQYRGTQNPAIYTDLQEMSTWTAQRKAIVLLVRRISHDFKM